MCLGTIKGAICKSLTVATLCHFHASHSLHKQAAMQCILVAYHCFKRLDCDTLMYL